MPAKFSSSPPNTPLYSTCIYYIINLYTYIEIILKDGMIFIQQEHVIIWNLKFNRQVNLKQNTVANNIFYSTQWQFTDNLEPPNPKKISFTHYLYYMNNFKKISISRKMFIKVYRIQSTKLLSCLITLANKNILTSSCQ